MKKIFSNIMPMIVLCVFLGCATTVEKNKNIDVLSTPQTNDQNIINKTTEFNNAIASKEIFEAKLNTFEYALDYNKAQTLDRIRASKHYFTEAVNYTQNDVSRICAQSTNRQKCEENVNTNLNMLRKFGIKKIFSDYFATGYEIWSKERNLTPDTMYNHVIVAFAINELSKMDKDPYGILRGKINFNHNKDAIAAGEFSYKVISLYYLDDEQSKRNQNVAGTDNLDKRGKQVENKTGSQITNISLEKLIEDINNGGKIKNIIYNNFHTLYGTMKISSTDEFGTKILVDGCKVDEVYNKVGKKNDVLKYYTAMLIGSGKYTSPRNANDNTFSYLLEGMASGEVQSMIRQGLVPSTVTFTALELEYLGKDFKGSFSLVDMMNRIMMYLYLQGGETSKNRNYLVSSFLFTKGKMRAFSLECDNILNEQLLLHYIVTSKNKVALKFLGALMSGDEARATNVLMSDPATKDIFNEMKMQ